MKASLALGFVVAGLLLLIFCSPATASDDTIESFTITDPQQVTGDFPRLMAITHEGTAISE